MSLLVEERGRVYDGSRGSITTGHDGRDGQKSIRKKEMTVTLTERLQIPHA